MQKRSVHTDRSQRVIETNLCTGRKLCGILPTLSSAETKHEHVSIKYARLNLKKYEEFLKNKDSKATCEGGQYTPSIPR